jgi:thioredoxin-related protein
MFINKIKSKKMKKNNLSKVLVVLSLVIISLGAAAQEAKKLYDPSLDGMQQIKDAIAIAGREGRHVLIQYGGNWCGWCIKFDAFCKADSTISKVIADNYIPVKLNYDQTNKNDAANAYMGNPTRFGFPVFIIIDGKGNVLHIQDSSLLEEDKGYNKNKVLGFFKGWTASAIIPVGAKPKTAK